MNFVGRHSELNLMNKMYSSDSFEFLALYGIRRVGKSALIDFFSVGKNVIVYQAKKVSKKDNLDGFSKEIGDYFGIPGISFSNYTDLFLFLKEKSKAKRLVVVIDEYPYITEQYKGISSELQSLIDRPLKDSNLMLILSGSSIGMMQNEILASSSPLYKRTTAEIQLKPFSYSEAMEMLKDFPLSTRFDILSVFGFSPYYLSQIKPGQSIEDIIKTQAFSLGGLLVKKEGEILNSDIRQPESYNSILLGLAKSKNTISELEGTTGIKATGIPFYISELIRIGAIERFFPFGKEGGKNSKYRLIDPATIFYY